MHQKLYHSPFEVIFAILKIIAQWKEGERQRNTFVTYFMYRWEASICLDNTKTLHIFESSVHFLWNKIHSSTITWYEITFNRSNIITRFLVHSDTEYRPIESLFHTFAEFRLIVNRIVARQSTDWLAANAQFSPNVWGGEFHFCGSFGGVCIHSPFSWCLHIAAQVPL